MRKKAPRGREEERAQTPSPSFDAPKGENKFSPRDLLSIQPKNGSSEKKVKESENRCERH
jgi:hypothetical protein